MRTLKERYSVGEKIGEGGMAEVFLGEDTRLGRPVVLKILKDHLAKDAEFLERFKREARSEASLSHPNIISVYDFDEQDGQYFIVMEYMDNARALSDMLREKGRLTEREVLPLARGILEALAFAHRNGIIHRDLKPHNVLVKPDGTVKVTDFGLAKALTSDSLTQTGAMVGTVQYFSPEQAQGKNLGIESDLYSMGILLYELLSGRVPFEGENPVAIAIKQVQAQAPSIREANPAVSQSMESVLEKAMRKLPAERFRSAEEFLDALAATQRPESPPTQQRAERPPAQKKQAPAAALEPVPFEVEPAAKGRKTGVFFVIVLMGVIAFLIGLLWPRYVEVPSLKGIAMNRAQTLMDERGLHIRIKDELYEGDVPEGTIIDQEPRSGERVRSGSTVLVTVSRGTQMVEVPSLIGKTREDAFAALRIRGLTYVVEKEAYSARFGKDVVIGQRPQAEGQAAVKSIVYLTVSKGPVTVKMPGITGKTEEEAAAVLLAAGLRLKAAGQEYSLTVPKGVIIRQTPGAQEDIPKDAEVKAVISLGAKEEIAPQLVGKTIAEATDFLAKYDMKLVPDGDFDSNARIIWQDPPAGQAFTSRRIHVRAEEGGAPPETGTVEEMVKVPSLEGKSEEECTGLLDREGLQLGTVTEEDSPEEKGKVIRQSPPAGESVKKGASVDIVVSKGRQ
jgi:serine/threonine-protein kinase